MEQIMGQIQAFAFNFPPAQWAFCDGQIIGIAQNQALFALLGTTYGGNGQTTFALPDLRGRAIVHPGQGPGLSNITWGEVGGVEQVSLSTSNIPAHVHPIVQGTGAGQVNIRTNISATPGVPSTNDTDSGANGFGNAGTYPAIFTENTPSTTNFIGGVTTTASGTTGIAGSNIPFGTRNPYLGIYMSIALYGIFPSRN